MKDGTTIVASVVVATGLTTVNQLLQGQKSMRPVIGGFVVGTLLLALAMFNTAIAAALALLLLVSSVLGNGVPVLTRVMGMAS